MAENRPPVAIRIVRPYETEDDFLSNELETVGKTSVILIGAHPRPNGVILRFEVTLANGATVLRGEGRVLAHKENAFRGQAGLALRFTRLDPKSKALVDRAASLRDSRLSGEMPVPPQPTVALQEEPVQVRRHSQRAREVSVPPDPVLAEALTSATPPPPPMQPGRSVPPVMPEIAEALPDPAPPADAAPPPHDDVVEVRTSEPEFRAQPPIEEIAAPAEDAQDEPPPRARPVIQLDPPTPPPPAAMLADVVATPPPSIPEASSSPPASTRSADRDALLTRLRERASRLSSERVEAILGRR